MKTVYFVRHGESEGNAGNIRLGYKGGLTELGHKQANELGQRCKNLPIGFIVCSSLQRTRETAKGILKYVSVPIEYSDLFLERRNPSEFIGLEKNTVEETYIRRTVWEHFHEPGWRYSDEENFDDLNVRAGRALEYLIERPEEHVLVVGHGMFTRVLLARMIFDENLTGVECSVFTKKFETENSGISVAEFDQKKLYWRIVIWNDHAHLG